jgi:hypothetical protein
MRAIGLGLSPPLLLRRGAAPASYTPSAATFDPTSTYRGTNISLSGSNLIATNTSVPNDWESVGATVSASSGKRYFELVLNNMPYEGDFMIGVAPASMNYAGYLGNIANGWCWQVGLGISNKGFNNAFSAYGASGVAANDVIGCLLDFGAGELSYTLNGVSQGVAFTGLSGTLRPVVSLYYLNPQCTARFNPASWSYSPPAGYDSWA